MVKDAEAFRKYLTEILEAYRAFIGQDTKTMRYNVEHFKQLIIELNEEFTNQLSVEFEDILNDPNKNIKASPIVFKKIFRNLYANTITEYKRLNIPFEKRVAVVSWFKSSDLNEYPEIVTIKFFNKGLRFNNENIRKYGITPIVSSSIGLGGYFINNTLGWLLAEENKFPDEAQTNVKRFIRVENVNVDVIFRTAKPSMNK